MEIPDACCIDPDIYHRNMEGMDDIKIKPVAGAARWDKGMHNSYWGNIIETFSTLWTGLVLTLRHFSNARKRWYPLFVKDESYYENDLGVFTVRYPHEMLPVPDNGRYKLHNEIEDCIVCDKCANVCPVDCIEIESIRSVKEFGRTSDGTPRKIYAARFDIDMAKCCYCGLCTTVCPTECLTMTKEFDFSDYEIRNHKFSFATMTPGEITARRKEWEEFETNQQKPQAPPLSAQPGARPMMKPKLGPASSPAQEGGGGASGQVAGTGNGTPPPMKFRPKIKMPAPGQPGTPGPEKKDEKIEPENKSIQSPGQVEPKPEDKN